MGSSSTSRQTSETTLYTLLRATHFHTFLSLLRKKIRARAAGSTVGRGGSGPARLWEVLHTQLLGLPFVCFQGSTAPSCLLSPSEPAGGIGVAFSNQIIRHSWPMLTLWEKTILQKILLHPKPFPACEQSPEGICRGFVSLPGCFNS